MKHYLSLFAAFTAFVLISCILGGEKSAGRGSEVENELGVYGVLVDEAGNPVKGAGVKARTSAGGLIKTGVSAQVAADSDSVVTDANGRYAFKKLGDGTYDLFGDFRSGSLVVLVPDVVYESALKRKNVGIDTLRAPGKIRGRLFLGDKGKSAVLCYVPGTSFLAVSDDSGRFVLSGIAQGRYTVGYALQGYAIVQDTGVIVSSGRTTELPPRQLAYDSSLPPPAPVGLRARFDASTRSVALAWDSVPVSDLEGYVVYRDEPFSQDPKILPGGFVRVASFVDTLLPLAEKEELTLTYRVKARDREANLSVNFSAPIQVTAAFTHLPPKVNAGKDVAVLARDTVRLRGSAEIRGASSIVSWEWDVGATGRFVRGGPDTLIAVPALPGPLYCVLKAMDNRGAVGLDTVVVTVKDQISGWHKAGNFLGDRTDFNPYAKFAAFAGRIWALGLDDITSTAIWSSPNGTEWVQSVPSLTGNQLTGAQIIAFKDRLWIFGHGFPEGDSSEIWSTADGKEWTKTNGPPAFKMRTYSACAVFKGELWLIGGTERGQGKSDVWRSADGINWTQATDSPGFGTQLGSLLGVLGDRMILVCALSSDIPIADGTEIWSSSDGIHWTEIAQKPPPNAGLGHLVFLEGKLRMMYGTIWSTLDGASWEQEYQGFPYYGSTKGYMNSGTFLFNDAVWVVLRETGSPAELWYWK